MPRILLLRTWTDITAATFTPPLGLMYLAATIRQHNKDYEVKIFDLNVKKQHIHQRIDDIKAFDPDVIGLGSMSYEANTNHKAAAYLKQELPRVKIVLGGPYPSASPLRCVRDPNIDFAVLGEGEETFNELLDRIFSGGTDFRDIKAISFKYQDEPIETVHREYRFDLDNMPFPAWDLIEMEEYFKVHRFHYIHVEKRYMPIYTSRACPYQCTYCHDIFGKTFRARSAQNVFEEIKTLNSKYGIKEFQFFDDIFNIRTDRAIAVMDLIIQSGLKVYLSFPNGLRGDIMTDELILKMKKAGTYKIAYAIESATPRIQKLIKKHVKLDRLKQVIEKTDKAGILCHGFFMMGFPTETREEVMNTVNYALDSRLHFGGFYFLDPFEGTEIADWALKMRPDLMEKQNHSYFSADRQLSEVPTPELEKMQRDLYRNFYFNPKRIIRMLWRLPKKTQAFSLIKLWFQMAFESFRYSAKPAVVPSVDRPPADSEIVAGSEQQPAVELAA